MADARLSKISRSEAYGRVDVRGTPAVCFSQFRSMSSSIARRLRAEFNGVENNSWTCIAFGAMPAMFSRQGVNLHSMECGSGLRRNEYERH